MKSIREFFKRDKYAELSGIELIDVTPGHAIARMPVRKHHLNGLCTVHGGAIFTLADFAFAVACNSHGQVAVAANVNISFLKAAGEGSVLTADARENAPGTRLAGYTVNVTDEKNELIAVFQGLAYRKKETLEDVVKNVKNA